MAKLPRVTAKIFASKAADNDIGQYGSALTGTQVNTPDIAEIQALPAYEEGWRGAVISSRNYPTLQEMNGLQKTFSQQIAYILQEGVAEYDAETTYYTGSIVKSPDSDNKPRLYSSLSDNNIGNPLTDSEFWQEISFGGSGSSLPLFTPVFQDHVLDFKESKGLALQGTWVYKTPVAGERYGYPNFYNRCIEEKNNTDNILVSLKNNVTVTGSPTINNGVASNFSTNNYLSLPNNFAPGSQTWEMGFKVKTGSTWQSDSYVPIIAGNTQYVLSLNTNSNHYLGLSLSSNGTSYNIANDASDTLLELNTDYWVKATFDGSAYKLYLSEDGNNYNLIQTIESSTPIIASTTPLRLGINRPGGAFWNGSIDLKECYIHIGGNNWWKGSGNISQNPNGHQFYDIADKSAVDTYFDSTGIADFYGIDEENERVFLPRNKWFMQLTTDTSDVNKFNAPGLPNITGSAGGEGICKFTSSGAMYLTSNTYPGGGHTNSATSYNINFNASRSSSIYGNSNTVQPSSSNKLLYYVVGNTEIEEAATDITQITTSDNDTFPLGYSLYQGAGTQPSAAWLASNGQWNSGNVYTTFYNYAVNKIGEAFAGGYIKESGDDYNDYDLVINQDDMTFRLPLLNGSEDLISNKIVTLPTSQSSYTAPANGFYYARGQSTADRQPFNVSVSSPNNTFLYMLTSQPNSTGYNAEILCPIKKGNIAVVSGNVNKTSVQFIYAEGNGTLYFKVANAVQNLELLDAGEIIETFVNKTELRSLIAPDFSTKTALPTTANLVQQMDKDGYLVAIGDNGTDMSIGICNADGVEIVKLPMADTTSSSASSVASPLLLAGTYFKVLKSGGTLLKFYAGGV